eukprot:CAMPEP_0206214758 /NCGR_PEP_ID=MMETSP0047_2-20121206/1836_1 /ASSEMBLY_ACC=CAM_ASM_000192 /TAXON_ID=195065 /ORGANISM="Chroomonas mesostigmatica_cf, Strain CCMP1168" /LENGTH=81 /DNA_ID=CAMNT_0053637015 /DNA_START=59 /DNA_END=301 /DNA_ORIENTATION=-
MRETSRQEECRGTACVADLEVLAGDVDHSVRVVRAMRQEKRQGTACKGTFVSTLDTGRGAVGSFVWRLWVAARYAQLLHVM